MEITEKAWNRLSSMVLENRERISNLEAEKEKERLTPGEVCSMLKISRRTYHRYIKEGIFSQIKQGNKKNSPAFVKRSEITRLQEEGII